MCNDSSLAALFGQFAGQEISLLDVQKANPADPVFTALRQVAEDNGYRLRLVWGTGSALTTDYDAKRANIQMEQQFDGKWRVGCHYHAG